MAGYRPLKSFGKGYSVVAYINEEAAMSVKLKDVENQVAQLTEDDRIRLVEQLIRSRTLAKMWMPKRPG